MNQIITAGDVKKFLALIKIGITEGRRKTLQVYTSQDGYQDEYYVSLELRYRVSSDAIENLLAEDCIDDQVRDILNNL